jgi:hypothetical protein
MALSVPVAESTRQFTAQPRKVLIDGNPVRARRILHPKAAENIKVGHGLRLDTEMGPLVSTEQFERVSNYLKIGLRSRVDTPAARPSTVSLAFAAKSSTSANGSRPSRSSSRCSDG